MKRLLIIIAIAAAVVGGCFALFGAKAVLAWVFLGIGLVTMLPFMFGIIFTSERDQPRQLFIYRDGRS
ncbi:hypothetical protein ACFW16_32565 [Inquilinus sp. NPDC058860]|uniref:hypothetical protein n=1 Tax=Inquilinus sp. NPDC058860 TaxID=3346652 RepID=UPI00367809DF